MSAEADFEITRLIFVATFSSLSPTTHNNQTLRSAATYTSILSFRSSKRRLLALLGILGMQCDVWWRYSVQTPTRRHSSGVRTAVTWETLLTPNPASKHAKTFTKVSEIFLFSSKCLLVCLPICLSVDCLAGWLAGWLSIYLWISFFSRAFADPEILTTVRQLWRNIFQHISDFIDADVQHSMVFHGNYYADFLIWIFFSLNSTS